MKKFAAVCVIAFVVFGLSVHARDEEPHVDVDRGSQGEKIIISEGESGRVTSPGEDAPGGPPAGPQTHMDFPDPPSSDRVPDNERTYVHDKDKN